MRFSQNFKNYFFYPFSDAEILYNKKPKAKSKQRVRKQEIKLEDIDNAESAKKMRKKSRQSEKVISQQLSESLKSSSFNSSMLANLSVDTIITDMQNVELDIEFSDAGKKARKKRMSEKINSDAKLRFPHMTRTDRPLLLTGVTLLGIIYSALNICGSNIQLTDLIRFVREGFVSFHNLNQFLPEDILEQDVQLSFQEHHIYHIIDYEQIRERFSYFTRLIPDLRTSFKTPNLVQLVHRYLGEMNLPSDLSDCIERLMIFLPPEMPFLPHSFIPNYEGRAMAYIVFVLKLLFGVDGYREHEMSDAARKVNQAAMKIEQRKLIFVYEDWREHIEYRRVVLEKFYYPTIFHPDYDGEQPYKAFNAMLASLNPTPRNMEMRSVRRGNEKRMDSKMNSQQILSNLINKHNDEPDEPMQRFAFEPTLTPLQDNFQRILMSNVPFEMNREVAERDYTKHSCEAFLHPKKLIKKFESIGVELHVKKSTFPKTFAFTQVEFASKSQAKKVYQLSLDMLTEDEWRKDLKKRQELKKTADDMAEQQHHENRMRQVLQVRKLWRMRIREKKSSKAATSCNTSSESKENELDEPRTFHEPNIFSDTDEELDADGDVSQDEIDFDITDDPELSRIFQSHGQEFWKDKLTLVVPDFNMWQVRQKVQRCSDGRSFFHFLPASLHNSGGLPESFRAGDGKAPEKLSLAS